MEIVAKKEERFIFLLVNSGDAFGYNAVRALSSAGKKYEYYYKINAHLYNNYSRENKGKATQKS